MERLFIALIVTFTFSFCSGQIVEKMDHCKCVDRIDQITPVPDGKFERTCNGKTIETGLFKNGKKEGAWISHSKKGNPIRKINYVEGQLHGRSELFYADGNPKLIAFFTNGEKTGRWKYFTSNGKVFMEGEFDSGKPINVWSMNDDKGRGPVLQYDYLFKKYPVEKRFDLHRDENIIQNDNTGEYYILSLPTRAKGNRTLPLGGSYLAGNMFIDLMEVPLEYWDTHAEYKYKAKFVTSVENKTTVIVETIDTRMSYDVLMYPFIIKTNPDSKLQKIEHTELSKKLLDFKILEALNFMPPWIYSGVEEVEVYIPFSINREWLGQ
ncbi:MAG: hypothetical protein V4615_00480 [Bacteroidota bacterium]